MWVVGNKKRYKLDWLQGGYCVAWFLMHRSIIDWIFSGLWHCCWSIDQAAVGNTSQLLTHISLFSCHWCSTVHVWQEMLIQLAWLAELVETAENWQGGLTWFLHVLLQIHSVTDFAEPWCAIQECNAGLKRQYYALWCRSSSSWSLYQEKQSISLF